MNFHVAELAGFANSAWNQIRKTKTPPAKLQIKKAKNLIVDLCGLMRVSRTLDPIAIAGRSSSRHYRSVSIAIKNAGKRTDGEENDEVEDQPGYETGEIISHDNALVVGA